MVTKVHMEALSPTMEEGQLIRWLKAEGDAVSDGDVLAEIETDKATMELVARGEGVLRRIFLGEGGTVPVGEVIGLIAAPDEDISQLEKDAGAPESQPKPTPEASDPEAKHPSAPQVAAPADPAGPGPAPPVSPSASAKLPDVITVSEGRVKASPVARRIAAEAKLDLNSVQGSGPGGRVVKRDVEAAQEAGVGVPPSPSPEKDGVESGRRSLETQGVDFEDFPLSQMRKTIAKRLVESIGPVPHFFLRITVDMDRILEARKRVNRVLERDGEKVSINDFFLRATAQALFRHPEVNAHWNGDSIRRHYRVHLGVAVAVEDGLITPVVRDANRKGLAEISREVRELATRGREKRLQPEEYTGSTFSVSNLGMFGIHEFTGVINPPEAGILAVGGIEETPVVEVGEVVVKPLMKVTMSCDHRVIDGATGARFLQTLKEMLEEPATILV